MSNDDCHFCTAPATPHGIHGAEHVALCKDCRDKFVLLRWWADPAQQSLLGFTCKKCGFTCDVPGKVEPSQTSNEYEVKVDSKHNYCQNCGEPSR